MKLSDTYEALYQEAVGLIEPENFENNPEYVRALAELVSRFHDRLSWDDGESSSISKDAVLARMKRDKVEG